MVGWSSWSSQRCQQQSHTGHRRDCSVQMSAGHRDYPTQLLHSPQCRDKILAEPESMTHWCRTHEHAALPPICARESHACITTHTHTHTSADSPSLRAEDIWSDPDHRVCVCVCDWLLRAAQLSSRPQLLINSSLCVCGNIWWASHVMMMMMMMMASGRFIYSCMMWMWQVGYCIRNVTALL